VPRVIFYFFLQKIGLGGPKVLQLQNLGGDFVVFFLRETKSQLHES